MCSVWLITPHLHSSVSSRKGEEGKVNWEMRSYPGVTDMFGSRQFLFETTIATGTTRIHTFTDKFPTCLYFALLVPTSPLTPNHLPHLLLVSMMVLADRPPEYVHK